MANNVMVPTMRQTIAALEKTPEQKSAE